MDSNAVPVTGGSTVEDTTDPIFCRTVHTTINDVLYGGHKDSIANQTNINVDNSVDGVVVLTSCNNGNIAASGNLGATSHELINSVRYKFPSNEMTFLTPHTLPDLSGSGVDKQIVILLNRRDRMKGRLVKQMLLVKMLLTQSNVDLVNNEIVNLDKLFSELADANEKYEELLPYEMRADGFEWIQSIESEVFELKKEVCTWMRIMEADMQSNSSRISWHSRRSGRSGKSNCSTGSNVSARSTENRVRIAPLQAEMAVL